MEQVNLAQYFGANGLDDMVALYDRLNAGAFDTGDSGIAYSTIAGWDEEGLLRCSRKAGDDDRQFNLCEFIWLLCVKEMRDMHVPVEAIRIAGEMLWESVPLTVILEDLASNPTILDDLPISPQQREAILGQLSAPCGEVCHRAGLTPIAAAVSQCLRLKTALSLRVFPSGGVLIWSDSLAFRPEADEMAGTSGGSFVNICLSGKIRRFLGPDGPAFACSPMTHLKPNEKQVLGIITQGQYDRVEINFREGRMRSMELTRSRDRQEKLHAVLGESDFVDVQVKKHRGRITYVQSTEKIYFEEE